MRDKGESLQPVQKRWIAFGKPTDVNSGMQKAQHYGENENTTERVNCRESCRNVKKQSENKSTKQPLDLGPKSQ
jgi:hypothetical protein